MMETIKTFAAPHKALRKIMSEFLVLAGQTNFKNKEAIENLKKTGNEMFMLLTSHAHSEDSVVLSLLESKLPGAAEHDTSDHIKIEQLQHELEVHLNRLNTSVSETEAHDFYLEFASFFGLYLEHIEEEETVTQKLIWENLTLEEQAGIHVTIVSKMDPDTYMIWMRHMIPAQNETENIAILGAIRQIMPTERFEKLMQVLEENMEENAFNALEHKLTAGVV